VKVAKRIRERPGTIAVFLTVVVILGAAAWLYRRKHTIPLPYRDSFAAGRAAEWTAFGGTWQLGDGAMRNDSDERGAKLVTGSPNWKDYSFSGDLELLGSQGDAGFMLRSSDEEQGVDSYRGYYAGLRRNDDHLVIGLADHGWVQLAAQPMPGGVRPFEWYHMKAVVHGCFINVTATDIATSDTATVSVTDKGCFTQGRIGLRSHSSGGVWKNLEVLPLSSSEANFAQASPPAVPPRLPYEVDEPIVEHATGSYRPNAGPTPKREPGGETNGEGSISAEQVESISSLRQIRTQSRRVTVRGTVILTFPSLYVQDATGGVAVISSTESHLKIGDEVEATGEVEVHDFSCTIRNASLRLLWAHTPAPAIAVTAGQAATGAFDARYIELDGFLWAETVEKDHTLSLILKSDGQLFRAVLRDGLGNAVAGSLGRRSVLRLRGVCVVDPVYTNNLTPFVLLIPTGDDIEVLAGPPWWSARNLLIIGLVGVTLALLAYMLYIHAKHWRLQAIVEERERIAHEMHDTLAQCFVGIGFQLQAISNGMPKEMHDINQQLDLASELVRHSHEEASRSLSTLRREFLESEPLHSALNAFACRIVEHGTIEVRTSAEGESASTPYRVKDGLFRIGQEAIANAIRHGSPKVLKIRLDYGSAAVKMMIEDDGGGFVLSGDLRGFGITGMKKRAEALSGSFNLSSTIGRGTLVEVVAPLPPKLTLLMAKRYVWKRSAGGWNVVRNGKKDSYSHRR
jgi:signal transduction histidine kinase